MENITEDILFYDVCYSDYHVAVLFPSLCKKYNSISKGYGKEQRSPKSYFLKYIENVSEHRFVSKYWINKFTGRNEGKYEEFYRNGTKYIECYYNDGKKEGKYLRWYSNGNKSKECKSFCRAKGERR